MAKQKRHVSYKCEKCGHKGTKAHRDRFADLKGVRRHLPGNACCIKCGHAIPYETS